ncbi:carbohydrate ABC transporter permease [Deinococcus roseus]|uniref:Sugar ABC transporter permease n=1 Tax=Deinococcus roseus TaxID=392414 RepID=A0ABQ2D1H8_9DEIO|nr:carbohydrate ABC transporter permease [Deinococcus roseus]GGJ38686.1 sugar ABC transporter permease [Deinococcus roseus]
MSQSPYRNNFQKPTLSDRIIDMVILTVMVLVVIVTLYPFLNVLAVSLNSSSDTVKGGVTIFPREFTLDNYRTIFNFGSIPRAFLTSILRTVIGTVTSLLACSMVAYVLSRKDFMFRNFLSRYLAITMYISGGLIPFFILIRDLHLMNTFTVYILPGLVNVFFIFMIRSFIDGLPYELQESAKLDGANDFTIFWRVILPLCKPVLATAALFIAVGQWNSWFDTYLFNGSNPDLTTLQFELMKILQSTQTGQDAVNGNDMAKQMQQVSPESIKMAITMVTTIPILLVYPFLQRYFVAGMTLGAVKG